MFSRRSGFEVDAQGQVQRIEHNRHVRITVIPAACSPTKAYMCEYVRMAAKIHAAIQIALNTERLLGLSVKARKPFIRSSQGLLKFFKGL